MKITRRSKKIQTSSDLLQYTARYWAELIEEIESEGYQVDSADRHKPAQWITAYKDGNEYEIEVNKYSDGTYEIVKADLVGKIKASCISKKGAVRAADEDSSEWIKLNRKYVLDSDGFYTDYTLYTNGDEYICMFGDEDIYGPDPDYADFSTDSEEEALEWFDSYEGMDETDEIYSSEQPDDIMQTIINAIHGDKNSIHYLKSNGYRVYVLHNPLQPQEVGTYEVVDPYGKIYNYDNTSSYYSQVRGTSEWADDLEHPDQEYDSAATSINSNKLPTIYKLVNFEPGKVYLDFGGGKFDNGVYYVRDLGATLLVYDPYNRSDEHNKEVLRVIKENGGADATLNSNVLNVIKEPEARLGVLNNIRKLTKPGGDVYITVYEGTGKGNEGPTKAGYQLNRKTEGYMEEVESVFPDAQRKGKLIHATNSGSVLSSRLIRSNCKITSAASASRIEIDAENLKGKSIDEIEQILDDAPIGSKVLHIRNLKNRFNMDVHIEKKSAYQANYYQGMGTPLDFKDEDTFWEVGAYKDPYIDDTIYKAVNGMDKYYGLTSEVLKAHGITSASYGGAYDILDDYYFTRDDLIDFGADIESYLEDIDHGEYFINDLDMLNPITIHVEIYCRSREAYADVDVHIDMRRIKKPSDLNKYVKPTSDALYRQLSEYDIESASESTTGREFVQTHEFSKQWDDLGLSDTELRALESLLILNPESGDLIPKSRGARKLRIQVVPSKGKRSGGRVVYVDYLDLEKLYMLSVYSKAEKSNLSPSEVSQIKDTIKSIEEEEHENV